MSTQLITRSTPGGSNVSVKDEPLTSFEVDSNFISLKNNKLEVDNNLSDITDAATARSSINAPSTNGSEATGTWNISINGNSGTTSNLQNPVNIQGVAFDGSQDIDVVTGVISSGFGISNFSDWDLNTDFTISVNAQEIVTIDNSQTVAGQKTFTEPVVLSSAGTSTSHAVRGDREVIAGDGISGGGNLSVNRTISHSNTSSQSSLSTLSGASVVSDIDLDGFGHVTNLSTRSITLSDLGFSGDSTASITSVSAGNGLNGGGTNGDVTVSHANTSNLSGSYGSTSNSTKIDNITVDANGHVTGITTGATGDITSVSAGNGLNGGGTNGNVTLNIDADIAAVLKVLDVNGNQVFP